MSTSESSSEDQDALQQNTQQLEQNSGSNQDSSSIRHVIGDQVHQATEVVNDNLIAARFGVFASVTLLTAYGLSHTPLFFRYRTVSELPGKRTVWKGVLH